MNGDMLKYLSSLGVGGMLAAGMFWVYRKDAIAAQERIRSLADATMQMAQQVFKLLGETQQSLTEATTLLNRLLARLDAREAAETHRAEVAAAQAKPAV